jgi:hypothetical protein
MPGFEKPDQPPPAPRAPEGATEVQGRPGGRTELDKKLKLPTNHDFYLMHHPNGWRLEKTSRGWEVLPVLKDLVLAGGINTVELTEKGPDSGAARTKLRDRGWTMLEDQDEYRVVVDVAGGRAHRLIWDRIFRFPDGDFEVQFDHEGYADWRRSLVEEGRIDPPRPKVLATLRARLERRLGRRSQQLHIPTRAAAQEADQERLEALEDPGAIPESPRRRAAVARAPRPDKTPPAKPPKSPPSSAKRGGEGTPI